MGSRFDLLDEPKSEDAAMVEGLENLKLSEVEDRGRVLRIWH